MKVVCRSSGDDPRIRLTPIKWHMELMENVVAGKQKARNQKNSLLGISCSLLFNSTKYLLQPRLRKKEGNADWWLFWVRVYSKLFVYVSWAYDERVDPIC